MDSFRANGKDGAATVICRGQALALYAAKLHIDAHVEIFRRFISDSCIDSVIAG